MTGPYDSILGRRYDRVLASTLTGVPHHYDVATGDPPALRGADQRRPGDRPGPGDPPGLRSTRPETTRLMTGS